MSTTSNISRKTTHLYRDCLRLIDHVAGKSAKGIKVRNIVRQEFKKNAEVKDPQAVEVLKSHAIRGLANFLMLESANKDLKFKNKVNEFTKSETERKNPEFNS